MITEAIDTAYTIAGALLAWLAVIAFIVTVALFTTVLAVAQGVKAARRRLRWRRNAAQDDGEGFPATDAPNAPQSHTGPRWAREPHDHQEAA